MSSIKNPSRAYPIVLHVPSEVTPWYTWNGYNWKLAGILIVSSLSLHAVSLYKPDATKFVMKAGGLVVVGGAVGTVPGVGLPGVSVPQFGWVDRSTAF